MTSTSPQGRLASTLPAAACAIENKILQACVRHRLGAGPALDTLPELLRSANWSHLLWRARSEQVLPFLHDGLREPASAREVPDALRTQLQAVHASNQIHVLERMREAALLQDIFDRQSVAAVLVEDWFAAHCLAQPAQLVPAITGIRYLVPAEELKRSISAIKSAGHLPLSEAPGLHKFGKDPIILNQGLGQHPQAVALWREAATVSVGGRRVRRLCPVHWVLQLVAQHTEASPPLLYRAWIIAALAASLTPEDWVKLAEEARRFEVEAATWRILAHCHEVLGLPIPPAVPPRVAAAPTVAHKPAQPMKPALAPAPAPYLPSPLITVNRMLELAAVGPKDVVYDLGCGDGRFVVTAAKRFGARGVGIDLDPQRVAEATALAAQAGVTDRVRFICGDLFAQDISDATVLCLYLLPSIHDRIAAKIGHDLKRGARVLCHDYILADLAPDYSELIAITPSKISQIFLWHIR